jgi:hypothetical protein
MSEPAGAREAPSQSLVVVARAVVDAVTHLPLHQQQAIVQALQHLDEHEGQPIHLTVPSAPPGSEWLALPPPGDRMAPVIIYRRMPPGDGGAFRIAALMPRADYDHYRLAEGHGIFLDPAVQVAAIQATDIAISTMGTISTFHDPLDYPVGPGRRP